MKKRTAPKHSLGRGVYRPYSPKKTGLTMSEAQKLAGGTSIEGVSPPRGEALSREALEAAIANAKRKYGYTMSGTLDVALASGAIPQISVLKSGETTLVGWTDAQGNVVKV